MENQSIIPLIIDGQDIVASNNERRSIDANGFSYQGATKALALEAVKSSAKAYKTWSKTTPIERRHLLLKLAEGRRVKHLCCEEIRCDPSWADTITNDGIGLIEECASLTTSVVTGSIPYVRRGYGLVCKEPLGVVLGIAPWNAPVILGLRAVVTPIAAGNVAILKGSELSPRVHYLLASMFRDAGFPPGVMNFLLHRPEDASEIFDVLINHHAIKKCNFTGSTQIGRIIASQAAMALKPVLLELGGKNFTIVLDDADLDLAADTIVQGSFWNNGQICMSTDLVLATASVVQALEDKILSLMRKLDAASYSVISPGAKEKFDSLVSDAREKGARIHTAPARAPSTLPNHYPPTLVTGLTKTMKLHEIESFGPVVGVLSVDTDDQMMEIIQQATYGLSSSIISTNHYRALELAHCIKAGAVHINCMTVHDEATLPHGGWGNSGWGRFGSHWGLDEFVQTKVVTMVPGSLAE